jgi:hypothetical protein
MSSVINPATCEVNAPMAAIAPTLQQLANDEQRQMKEWKTTPPTTAELRAIFATFGVPHKDPFAVAHTTDVTAVNQSNQVVDSSVAYRRAACVYNKFRDEVTRLLQAGVREAQ